MREFVKQRLAPREHHDFRAHLAESQRNVAPDPARRARDEHHAIAKIPARLGIRRIVLLLCQPGSGIVRVSSAGCPTRFSMETYSPAKACRNGRHRASSLTQGSSARAAFTPPFLPLDASDGVKTRPLLHVRACI